MAPLTIVVPLYIYPLPGAWDALFAAATCNPSVLFICVINPNSGPGENALPDESYSAVLTRLCTLPNVQLVGYVHCSYGTRDPATIKAEIDVYAKWESLSGNKFWVEGIFMDEVPWEPTHREGMALLAGHVRKAWRSPPLFSLQGWKPSSTRATGGDLPRKTGMVIYNPGVVVATGYYQDANLIVVFEQSIDHWTNYFLRQGLPQIPLHLRHKMVAMVHSYGHGDSSIDESRIATSNTNAVSATPLVDQIRQLGFGGIYITDQLGGGYSQWPLFWDEFVSSVSNGRKRV